MFSEDRSSFRSFTMRSPGGRISQASFFSLFGRNVVVRRLGQRRLNHGNVYSGKANSQEQQHEHGEQRA
jgi:hypothetical protein